MSQFGGHGTRMVLAIVIVIVVAAATFTVMKAFKPSVPQATMESVAPSVFPPRGAGWSYYGSDVEGRYYYRKAEDGKDSPGITRAWSQLILSEQGKQTYIQRRQKLAMSTADYDNFSHRDVLYELNCISSEAEFCIREVFELTGEDKTLDYARSGSNREWLPIPKGSILDQLAKAVCPPKQI